MINFHRLLKQLKQQNKNKKQLRKKFQSEEKLLPSQKQELDKIIEVVQDKYGSVLERLKHE